MTPCPGACNAWWRALTQQDTAEQQPRPGEPIWCHPCQATIRRKLAELPDLAALRATQADGYHEQPRHPARGTTTPSPSPAADDIDELDDMLVGWEMAYRADFNRRNPDRPMLPSPPRRGVLATIADTTAAWLTRHLDDILASDMAVPFGEEIADKHRELMAKTRAGTGRRRSYVPCPACGLRLLDWADGYEGLRCANCNRHVPKDEHDELAAIELEAQKTPAPA